MLVVRSSARVAMVYPAIGIAALGAVSLYVGYASAVAKGGAGEILRIAPIVLLLVGFIYGAVGLWWWLAAGRTRYCCDGKYLSAFRGRRLVKSVKCDEVAGLVLGPSLTVRDLFWQILADFPSLEIDLRDAAANPTGAARRVVFPPILIWGERALTQAETELKSAVLSRPDVRD